VIAYLVDWHPKITSFSIVFIKINGIFLPAVAMKVKQPWVLGGPCASFLESPEEFSYLFMRHR
jgi:hypothetical protein